MRLLPEWLKVRAPQGAEVERINGLTRELGLHTVCQEACCPNRGECFSRGTATFMILGDRCSRDCRFCAVEHGPEGPPDPDEPGRVAEAARRLELAHVVVTSVTRDDLDDGGAGQFAATVRALRQALPQAVIEVLVPDFAGDAEALRTVLRSGIQVLNHNTETVPRLYPAVRPQAVYRRSLDLLRRAAGEGEGLLVKSGLMVGLGEREDEVAAVMDDLRQADCDLLTIGQYLAPSPRHLPVAEFVHPDKFEEYRSLALARGFKGVASSPLTRSSYRADLLAGFSAPER